MRKLVSSQLAGVLLGLAMASSAFAQQPGSVAPPILCQFRGASFQTGQAICLNGFRNECQPNGAWVVSHDAPCTSDFKPSAQSCPVGSTESAAPGTQRCQQHRLYECSESGYWVTLGRCGVDRE